MPARHTNLRDAHLHLAAHGEELSAVPLADCTSVEECLKRVHDRASGSSAGSWIVARGARVEAWHECRYPSADELHHASGGRPVLVASFDHHAGSGSPAALTAAGITRDSADPIGGVVERNASSGEPSGVVLEAAFKALCGAMPQPSDEDVKDHIRASQRDLCALGFVEAHDMMTTAREARLLCELDGDGELALSVTCYAVPAEFDEVRAMLASMSSAARVRFGGLKIFTDGTLNSRTAHMLTPYADPLLGHPCGTPLMSRAEIDHAFARARDERFDIAAHAIGDGAVRTLLDAYEAGAASNGERAFDLRIEHAQFIDEADVPRFASMGVVASVQPCHLLTDIEATVRLTPDRVERAFPLRDLIDAAHDAGCDPARLIYFGSDTPVVPPIPGDTIQAAVERRRADPACPVLGASQAIAADEAWALMKARTH